MKERKRAAAKSEGEGIIDRNRNYTLAALTRVLGVDSRTVRDARRAGLKAKTFGGRLLVFRGADIDAYLENEAKESVLPARQAPKE